MNIGLKASIAFGAASLLAIGQASADPGNTDPAFGIHCSNASLDGHFGFYRAGSTPAGTLASVGLIQFDGHGNFTATQNISKDGAYQFDVDFNGTYQVNADCTG